MTKDEDLFADDTDIFADIPKPKEKEPKKKKKTTTAPKKTIFKDDIGTVDRKDGYFVMIKFFKDFMDR